jgi:tetratricopeptide (TPR) repeat protein
MGGDHFRNSGNGEQNTAQGDHPIGKQENNFFCRLLNRIFTVGNQSPAIAAGGNVSVSYNSAPPLLPVIPDQRPALEPCFLHRYEELVWLNERLQPGAVVAVCGPGGMGKSALAAKAVHQLEPARFPDGIVFHSFYGHPATEEALQAVCAAFQVEAKAGLESAVRQVLSGRRALLMLDGTEEAHDLPTILKLRGQCGVLITSRKRTDAQGVRLDLIPLEEQQAAEVFSAYSGPMDDAASVAGICTLLGGWPVALRIAGRYLSSTGESAADYLRWLEQEPFKELATGQHQEENAALLLRRSVAAVSEDARLALGMAGWLAFAPIAREPLAAILDSDERRARNALNELVNYGLLETRQERWQTSHALIHTYARTELALSTESLEQLAGWYIAFCEAASEEGVQGYLRLDDERAHCLRLMESCLASKLWQEVKLLAGAINTYLDRQGHWTEKLSAFEMALIAAQQAGDRKDEGVCLNNLGYTYRRRGEYEKALSYYEQSLPIHREVGDKKEEGVTLNNIAEICQQQDNYDKALEYFEQSLTVKREINDRKGEGTTLNNIGQLYDKQRKQETALQHYELSLSIARELVDKPGEGITLNNIASTYRAQGKHTKALEYYHNALAICQQLGERAGEAVTHWNIGTAYIDIGDLAKAEEHISQAVQIAEQIGHPSLEKYREGLKQVRARRRG